GLLADAGIQIDSQQDPSLNDSSDNRAENMLTAKANDVTDETGQKYEFTKDGKDSLGHQVHIVDEIYKDGSEIIFTQDKTDGSQTLTQDFGDGSLQKERVNKDGSTDTYNKDKNGNWTLDERDSQGHEIQHWTGDKDGNSTRDTYDAQGHLIEHQTEDKKGNWTDDKYDAQGNHLSHDSGKSSGASIPSDDPDSQAGAPHVTTKQLQGADAAVNIGPGSHDGDNVNVTNSDVPGTVSASDLKGGKVDGNQHLLGGDTTSENYSQQGGHIGGTPQP